VLFAAATGLRPGEWLALEHRDIDREAQVLYVRRSLRNGRIKTPKTKASLRAVPLQAVALAALDVVLYTPLDSDGMSRVIFECLAAGRPLVAARVGVVPEVLIDGEHAALVPGGDAPALAAVLERLVGDPALAARLGEGGRRLVEARYSGARVAAALEARYTSLAAAGAA